MSAIVQQDSSLERLLTELEFEIHGLVECRISTGWRVSLPTIGRRGICYVSGSPCRMIVGGSRPMLFPTNSVAIIPSGKSLLLEAPGERPLRTLSLPESEMAALHAASASRPLLLGTTIMRRMSFTFPSEHIGVARASFSVTYTRQLLTNLVGTTLYVKPSTKLWRNTGGLNSVLQSC